MLFRPKPIDTKLKNLIPSRFPSFCGTLLLALFLIAFKGGSGEGQPGLFSNLVRKYIEETAASISITNTSHNVADLTSLAVLQDFGQAGHGGPEIQIELSTNQDSSIFSNSPVSLDYMDFGFKQNQVAEYEVQPGDAISFIASDYGVSIDSIIWANGLTSADNIKPGQILRIPPVTGVIHKIKTGDTVASLAKKYSVEEQKIIEFNRLSGDGAHLAIDEELIIPGGKGASTAAKSSSTVARFSYLPDLGDYYFIPTTGYNWGRIHGRNGVDIANARGTPIFAAADGSVAIADDAGWNGGFGKYIKIIHPNGTETIYAHLDKILVSAGQLVQRGQQIGKMGTTGRSTGYHLHFEVHGARNPLLK